MTTDQKKFLAIAADRAGVHRIDDEELLDLADLQSLVDGEELDFDEVLKLGDKLAEELQLVVADSTPTPAPAPAPSPPPASFFPQVPPAGPSDAAARELETARARVERLSSNIEDLKRQSARERDAATRFANENLLRAILPALDNLERAVESTASSGAGNKALVDGVRMVLRQLRQGMVPFGLRSFDSVGQPFDPNVHEAAQQVNNPRYPPGAVIAEFKRGYMLNDRLLRPALVAVNSGQSVRQPSPAPPPATEAPDAFDLDLDLD